MTAPAPDPAPDKPRISKKALVLLMVANLAALALIVSVFQAPESSNRETIDLNVAVGKISAGEVSEATMVQETRTLQLVGTDGKEYEATYPVTYEDTLTSLLVDENIDTVAKPVPPANTLGTLLLTLAPALLIVGFLIWMLRKQGGALGIGRLSGNKTTPVEVPSTRFDDIAGMDEAVEDVREVVTFLDEPDRFARTGARVPKGVLLAGPPGSGKTLLARAVAGEAGVPFFAISGSDLVEVFVGVGASRVRQLFAKAREAGKAIVFIDEIDAIGRARGSGGIGSPTNDERESTLNQLLVELDGFAGSEVIVIAATNRMDVLDSALVRPGRFDRRIIVANPDRKGRAQILQLHAKGKPFAEIDWDSLAKRTPGMSGAELESLINESALIAARRGSTEIEMTDLEDALHTTVLGRQRTSAAVTDRDREIVAWHEAGHTVSALVLEDAADPVTVSVVPRGPAGGVTWMEGSEHDFTTRNQARAQLVVSMSGRAGEEILLNGDYSQGAAGDLQSATSLATMMVTRWGMGRQLTSREMPVLKSGDDPVDSEVAEMLEEALAHARRLLREHRLLLETVATELLERETLDAADLAALRAQVEGSGGDEISDPYPATSLALAASDSSPAKFSTADTGSTRTA